MLLVAIATLTHTLSKTLRNAFTAQLRPIKACAAISFGNFALLAAIRRASSNARRGEAVPKTTRLQPSAG